MTLEKKLTYSEAYEAMFSFLEEYYKRTGSDDIGSLLSGMCLMDDAEPMDKAYISEWQDAITRTLSNEVNTEVSFVTKND